jgi:hypothetical protein
VKAAASASKTSAPVPAVTPPVFGTKPIKTRRDVLGLFA